MLAQITVRARFYGTQCALLTDRNEGLSYTVDGFYKAPRTRRVTSV